MNGPLEALAGELGAIAARIERDVGQSAAVVAAELREQLASARAQVAELEARLLRAEQSLTEAVTNRLAAIRDGADGAAGRDGRDGVDGKDGERGLDGANGKDGRDGIDGKDGAPGERGLDGAPGKDGRDGLDGKDGAPGERGLDGTPGKDGRDGVDGKDGAPGERGLDGAPGRDGRDGVDGKDGAPGERGLDGAPGRDGRDGIDGRDGAPGKLPLAKEWTERVWYEADVVTHGGGTYQARRDTGHPPPHADWIVLAAAGRNGADGRSFRIRGTWSETEAYDELDVVALGGASFAARRAEPGPCPGDGWQLIASQGKRGPTGEPGPRGEGLRGEAGPKVAAMAVDDQGLLTLTNADGSIVTCDLYPLLIRLSR